MIPLVDAVRSVYDDVVARGIDRFQIHAFGYEFYNGLCCTNLALPGDPHCISVHLAHDVRPFKRGQSWPMVSPWPITSATTGDYTATFSANVNAIYHYTVTSAQSWMV